MKNLLKLALLAISASANAEYFIPFPYGDVLMANNNENAEVAIRYLEFLQKSSSYNEEAIAKHAERLCAPDCRKILNGKVVFENRQAYAEQMMQAKKALGAWAIEPLEILSSFQDRVTFIRHLVNTKNAGRQIVFVILRYNSESMITEIDEVYNSYE